MIAFLILFFHAVISPLKTRAGLEAEIIVLRHQLNVLRRRVPSKPKLAVTDRLLFVWLYRLFPSMLNAVALPFGSTRAIHVSAVPHATARWTISSGSLLPAMPSNS
jgi:hypothetical protein